MKKYFTMIIAMLLMVSFYAQELPNADLESWIDSGTYEEPEFWTTPNPFTSLAGVVTVSKSEDAYSGTYSARLETKDLIGGLYQAPGMLTYADFNVDFQTGEFSFSGGLPMTETVDYFSGMYKYTGVDKDSAAVVIISFRHPEGEEADTVGSGFVFLHDAEDWTEFTVKMIPISDNQPDTFNVIILSSGSTELKAGSVMFVDDLSISLITGIEEQSESDLHVDVFPNPVRNEVTFNAHSNDNDRSIAIYDMTGRMVRSVSFNGEKLSIDMSDLPEGVYAYHISRNNSLLKSGSLIKR